LTVEIRTCASEEVNDALAPISHFFGRKPDPKRTERFMRVLAPERVHAAWEDGSIVAGGGAFSFSLTVPGGRLPAAGITVVAVLPTHRRRGILTQLMRAQLDDAHRRGEPLACLWASEETIYGRFGYGMASLTGELDLARRFGAFRSKHAAAVARLLDTQEALELIPAIYERVAVATPGMFARSRDWWETRSLSDERFGLPVEGEQMRVLLELDGSPSAYAVYQVEASFAGGSSSGIVHVVEAMGDTPAATAGIWRYLLDIDWLERVRASLVSVDHPLFFLLAEPRRMGFRVGDALWLRLVDVGAALSGRSYAEDSTLVLEVRDSFCPWNDGRWKLQGGVAERTTAPAELALDVADLASVYLGGFTWSHLAAGGLLEELAEGALERADAMFHRLGPAPWCPEIF
jgi:predicted acetyltransferase